MNPIQDIQEYLKDILVQAVERAKSQGQLNFQVLPDFKPGTA